MKIHIAALTVILSAGSSAQALFSVGQLEMENRACLQTVRSSQTETYKTGVSVRYGATSYENDMVNRAVARMNSLAKGGRFTRISGLEVVFSDYLNRRGACVPASQKRGYVEMGRYCAPGQQQFRAVQDQGVGLLVHEIGHYVGNRGRGYEGYPGGCRISGYCTHSSRGKPHSPGQQMREEFAEVFAAYVLAPHLLHSTRGCSAAFRHMQKLFAGPAPEKYCGDAPRMQGQTRYRTRSTAY